MIRLLKRSWRSEKGQALPIVLALLAIGGLTIAVNLNYATTNLKGGGIVREDVKGIYAASAGVENVLWALKGGTTPPTQLQNVNQMAVGIQTVNDGTFTLIFGQLIFISSSHNDWLDVDGTITATNVSGRYRYTITVTRQPDCNGNKKLIEVGARLPVGYSYLSGSAAGFPSNMSTSDPITPITTDSSGAYMPRWTWQSGQGPELKASDPVKTQSFYITGSSALEGDYAWTIAQDSDIGTVGEITGTLYKITSTATRPQDSKTTAKVVANAIIKDDGTINILSWQITK